MSGWESQLSLKESDIAWNNGKCVIYRVGSNGVPFFFLDGTSKVPFRLWVVKPRRNNEYLVCAKMLFKVARPKWTSLGGNKKFVPFCDPEVELATWSRKSRKPCCSDPDAQLTVMIAKKTNHLIWVSTRPQTFRFIIFSFLYLVVAPKSNSLTMVSELVWGVGKLESRAFILIVLLTTRMPPDWNPGANVTGSERARWHRSHSLYGRRPPDCPWWSDKSCLHVIL